MKSVFLCSGQGSQYPGMGKELCEISSEACNIYKIASDILQFDLLKASVEASEDELARTELAQPAIMAVSLAAAAVAKEHGILPQVVAGHSLGEYAALCIAGVLSLEDGFRVIRARAHAMEQAANNSSGKMVAVLGLTPERIEEICADTPGYVLPVNYNSPAQTVIAGEIEAVSLAEERLKKETRRVVPLKVASAFHSKLMEPAVAEFAHALDSVSFSQATLPIYSNLTGTIFPQDACWSELLCRHLVSPVQFTKELSALFEDGFDTYIELGPGKTLTGLVRKTLSNVTVCHIENQASLQEAETVLQKERK